MRRETAAGVLLIAGALAGIVVLAFHPTAHDLLEPGEFARQARRNVGLHGLALAGVPLVFLGFLGLRRRLGGSDVATAALVAYGLGAVAVVSAAVASGFVATEVLARVAESEGGSAELHHALAGYTGLLNQGFAKVTVVATSVAIVLWGAAILRGGRMGRAVGIAGAIVGGGILLLFLVGHIRMDVHGFGIVTFAQSGWMAWVGALLLRA